MKAKKATAGEREVMRQYNVTMDQVRGRTCYTLAARDIDRLIARERRKERADLVTSICAYLVQRGADLGSVAVSSVASEVARNYGTHKKRKPAKKGATKR